MLPSLLLLAPPLMLFAPASAAPRLVTLAPEDQLDVQCAAVTKTVTTTVYEGEATTSVKAVLGTAKPDTQLSTSTTTITTRITTRTTTTAFSSSGQVNKIVQPEVTHSSAVNHAPIASSSAVGGASNTLSSVPASQPQASGATVPAIPAAAPNNPKPVGNETIAAQKPGTFRNALYFTNW